MRKILTKIVRGALEGRLEQEGTNYYAIVSKGGRTVKESPVYNDQDEAEVELGTLIDQYWRESSGLPKTKTVRRL